MNIENHRIVPMDSWVARRKELLAQEKLLTQHRDRIAAERRAMPWVRIEKDYVFDTPEGPRKLADLFEGRRQLMVQHFMLGPGWAQGCPSCSYMADHTDGMNVHLAQRDVTFLAISRAQLAEIERFRQRMGWKFPWVSSFGTDFNLDYNVQFSEQQQREGGIEYNYRREAQWTLRPGEDPNGGLVGQIAATTGTDVPTYTRERPGVSAFVRENGIIYHSYSAYARGLDGLWGMYQWLDRAPRGRNETGVWWRRHDEYGSL